MEDGWRLYTASISVDPRGAQSPIGRPVVARFFPGSKRIVKGERIRSSGSLIEQAYPNIDSSECSTTLETTWRLI